MRALQYAHHRRAEVLEDLSTAVPICGVFEAFV